MAEATGAPASELIELMEPTGPVTWARVIRAVVVAGVSHCPQEIEWTSSMHIMAHYGFFKTMNALLSCDNDRFDDIDVDMEKNRQTCSLLIGAFDSLLSTPIFAASDHGHQNVVDLLLKHGANAHIAQPSTDLTPLHVAIKHHAGVARSIVTRDSTTVEYKDFEGHTPLSRAVDGNKIDIVRILLPHTKLIVHSKTLSPELFIWKKKKSLPIGTPLTSAFCDLGSESVEIFRLLLEYGEIDRNVQDDDGRTLLHYVSDGSFQFGNRWDHFDKKAQLLIQSGKLDLNVEDNEGLTPFTAAVMAGHEEVVKMFLNADGVAYEHVILSKYPRFMYAVLFGDTTMIQTLLDSGKVDVEAKRNNLTRYLAACMAGRVDVVRMLLTSGKINLSATYHKSWPALMLAIETGESPETVQLMLEHGQWSTAESVGGAPAMRLLATGKFRQHQVEERRRIKEIVDEYVSTHVGETMDLSIFEAVFVHLERIGDLSLGQDSRQTTPKEDDEA